MNNACGTPPVDFVVAVRNVQPITSTEQSTSYASPRIPDHVKVPTHVYNRVGTYMKQLEKNNKALEESYKAERQRGDTLSKAVELTTEELARVTKEHEESVERYNETNAKLLAMDKDYAKQLREHREHEMSLRETQAELQDSSAQLNDHKLVVNRKDEDLEAHRRRVSELEKELERMQREREAEILEKEAEQQEIEVERQQRRLQREAEEREREVAEQMRRRQQQQQQEQKEAERQRERAVRANVDAGMTRALTNTTQVNLPVTRALATPTVTTSYNMNDDLRLSEIEGLPGKDGPFIVSTVIELFPAEYDIVLLPRDSEEPLVMIERDAFLRSCCLGSRATDSGCDVLLVPSTYTLMLQHEQRSLTRTLTGRITAMIDAVSTRAAGEGGGNKEDRYGSALTLRHQMALHKLFVISPPDKNPLVHRRPGDQLPQLASVGSLREISLSSTHTSPEITAKTTCKGKWEERHAKPLSAPERAPETLLTPWLPPVVVEAQKAKMDHPDLGRVASKEISTDVFSSVDSRGFTMEELAPTPWVRGSPPHSSLAIASAVQDPLPPIDEMTSMSSYGEEALEAAAEKLLLKPTSSDVAPAMKAKQWLARQRMAISVATGLVLTPRNIPLAVKVPSGSVASDEPPISDRMGGDESSALQHQEQKMYPSPYEEAPTKTSMEKQEEENTCFPSGDVLHTPHSVASTMLPLEHRPSTAVFPKSFQRTFVTAPPSSEPAPLRKVSSPCITSSLDLAAAVSTGANTYSRQSPSPHYERTTSLADAAATLLALSPSPPLSGMQAAHESHTEAQVQYTHVVTPAMRRRMEASNKTTQQQEPQRSSRGEEQQTQFKVSNSSKAVNANPNEGALSSAPSVTSDDHSSSFTVEKSTTVLGLVLSSDTPMVPITAPSRQQPLRGSVQVIRRNCESSRQGTSTLDVEVSVGSMPPFYQQKAAGLEARATTQESLSLPSTAAPLFPLPSAKVRATTPIPQPPQFDDDASLSAQTAVATTMQYKTARALHGGATLSPSLVRESKKQQHQGSYLLKRRSSGAMGTERPTEAMSTVEVEGYEYWTELMTMTPFPQTELQQSSSDSSQKQSTVGPDESTATAQTPSHSTTTRSHPSLIRKPPLVHGDSHVRERNVVRDSYDCDLDSALEFSADGSVESNTKQRRVRTTASSSPNSTSENYSQSSLLSATAHDLGLDDKRNMLESPSLTEITDYLDRAYDDSYIPPN